MSKIEDVMHEAYKMGVNETVINRVGELKLKEKNKYVPLGDIYDLAFNEIKNSVLTSSDKNVGEIEEEIKSLKNALGEIQSDCKHTNFTIKYIQEIKSPKRVCDNCNKDIGYANDKELKDSGFM
jgi:uncharacterized protein (UPF0335 family)